LNPPQGTETIDLFGPLYTIRQVAEQLGRALDKDLEVVDIPPVRQSDALVEAGIPGPWQMRSPRCSRRSTPA
jgi:uncharacterized protein YbjT (DUF2867 family)